MWRAAALLERKMLSGDEIAFRVFKALCYLRCETGATGTGGSVSWNQYGGSGNIGTRTNSEILLRCIEERDYRLRKATTGEWVAGFVFLPLTLRLAVLSAGQYPSSDIRYGGGSAEP